MTTSYRRTICRSCIDAVKSDPNAIWTAGEVGYLNGTAVGVAETANQLGPSRSG